MKRYLALFKQTFKEFGEDKVPRLGAALAYYTIFSVAPLLLIAIAMAGIFLGQEAAQGRILAELSKVLGTTTAKSIQELVENAAKPQAGAMATIIGIVTLLFGASGVFGQLKDALNTIWEVPPKKSAGMMGFLKDRFLSMAMVLGVGFLLLVTLVFDAAISAMGGYIDRLFPGAEAVLQIVQLVISFGLVTVLFAMIFRYLPDIRVEWRDVWFGAAFTSLLFVIGKFALGLYLGKGAVGSSYGAAGSLVVLLVWVYYSAQILFFGAEFTQVYAHTHGSKMPAMSPEAALQKRADEPRGESRPEPRPVSVIYARQGGGGGGMKLAIGGLAGMFVGTIVGSVGLLVMMLKSLKKLFT